MSYLDQEFRARELADSLRKFLLSVNSGAIGVLFSVAGVLVSQKISPSWAMCPALWFVGGILGAIVSNFFAHHRALKRRDALKQGLPEPFFSWWQKSITWHIFSAFCFVAGVLVALSNL
jgi:hypothetical protein